uniref:Dolichyl-diphosphooligosaccharide--protein glycosyltransferase subunit 2 n=1 Tax=Panagrolaimus sp. ES5 TaxID=591445 RepID=A0AC34FZ30_9BILA
MNLRLVIIISTLFVAAAFAGQATSKQPAATTAKTHLTVDDVKLAVYQRSATPSHTPVKPNTKDTKVYDVDKQVKVQLMFNVKDEKSKESILVQQAFVAFVHKDSDREVLFVAEPEAGSKTYVAEIDMKAQEKNFEGLNGTYNVRIIIGDTNAANAIDWNLVDDMKAQEKNFEGLNGTYNVRIIIGDTNAANAIDWNLVDVKVTTSPFVAAPTKKSQIVNYDPLPEIKHLFREPEKRPSAIISDTFTILCMAPMLLLFIMWFQIGLNFNNVKISLWSLGFHAGLFAIFGLYFVFWLQLNMFETLKYLAIIAVPTFFCGNRLLRSLNESRSFVK